VLASLCISFVLVCLCLSHIWVCLRDCYTCCVSLSLRDRDWYAWHKVQTEVCAYLLRLTSLEKHFCVRVTYHISVSLSLTRTLSVCLCLSHVHCQCVSVSHTCTGDSQATSITAIIHTPLCVSLVWNPQFVLLHISIFKHVLMCPYLY